MNKIFTIPSMTLFFILTLQSVVAQVDTANDKDAIKQLVTNYENAWNRHDPKGLADNYDNNATWVNWFGAYYIGKEDIQNHYEIVHTSYFKSSHYYTRAVEDIIFVKPDVAISHIRTGLSGDTRFPGKTFEFRRTIILTKKDGKWLILAGQNAKLNDGID
ncbi:SgcJ/EcaC family oxidoreductase [Flavobacterium sp. JLP]|uniref:YybH family protein n=1 Tax=unclassified Flavobacterium TaxID=196869 RepID=UPI00188C24A7|nr:MULTISPECIES: SgcJ/EcaC family oxidoreductase [unclassified Flavobacterium]MBF4491165.1 SgcJ/EcaC family oxidoreductase [Flavobacterium sp. MR2016-29]MBF4505286.1 SgcJ/EcaC family oxidoreductase [Flavobacterium sp. JLP]